MKIEIVNDSTLQPLEEALLPTPLGTAQILGTTEGVTEIKIIDRNSTHYKTSTAGPVQTCSKELSAYFKGELQKFSFPLTPRGTDFQKRVWQILQEIPYGETITYLEQARRLGNVKAIRAVASANGRNPLWVVVPCHRVIGSDGSLTGYAGGLWRKKWLLEHEGARSQLSLF